jgi:ADP-ribosylglycohydrolase
VDAGGFDPARFAMRLLNFIASGRLIGGGPAAVTTARQLARGTPWHEAGMPPPYASNGAAMRAGPLGLLFGGNPRVLARVVADQARITHQDPRCAAGALAIAGAAAIAARRERVRSMEFLVELSGWVEPLESGFAATLWDMANWIHLPPDAAVDVLCDHGVEPRLGPGWQGVSSFVTSSVCWSLYAFLQAPDRFWDAVRVAIQVGGDTDTLAAMTGSISGARLGGAGLPPILLGRLTDAGAWPAEELAGLARRVHQLAAGGGAPLE